MVYSYVYTNELHNRDFFIDNGLYNLSTHVQWHIRIYLGHIKHWCQSCRIKEKTNCAYASFRFRYSQRQETNNIIWFIWPCIDLSCRGVPFVIITYCSYQLSSIPVKGKLSDSFFNYNDVGNTKVSVSIKKTEANKCTLSELFLTEI